MTDKEMQATKRLAKKLSALRKTLRKDEREILDRLVTRQNSEVEGHTLESSRDTVLLLRDTVYTAMDSFE